MKLFQPYPDHRPAAPVPPGRRVPCPVPVYHVRYRYPHHAARSGYDRLADYLGETVPLSRGLHALGETLLRAPALLTARFGGQYEYSRYDYVMEQAAIRHFLRHRGAVYHALYGEKSYRRLGRFAGRNGNRIVVTLHHPPEHNAWLFRSTEHLRRVDLAVVVSRNQLPYWAERLGADRVRHVPYAVDTDYFTPAPAPAAPRAGFRCLFAGFHERDFDRLPEVADRLLRTVPGCSFTMVCGDPRCAAVVARNPRAAWRPRVDDDAYRALLQSADALVLPLVRSTTSTAVLEALACGVPVVTNRGGIEDYLDGRCSLLAAPGDADGLVAAAAGLAADPARRAAMSRAARERALRFAWPAAARAMAGVYAETLERPARAEEGP